MTYKVVSSSTKDGLEKNVNELIDKGWELSGGVAIGNGPTLYQGVFKKEDNSGMDEHISQQKKTTRRRTV